MVEKCEKSKQPAWFLDVLDEIEEFTKCLDDKVKREDEQREACKKKTELESKLALERKLNKELTEHLSELCRRGAELERAVATPVAISDNDQKRLDTAKEMYQIGKELTGIRFDFSATSSVVKGYIKSDARKLLQPFEVAEGDSEALWSALHSTAHPVWTDKENRPHN